MDSLLEIIPIVGDVIRIGKFSLDIGKKIGEYAEKQMEEIASSMVFRRFDVFIKEEKKNSRRPDLSGKQFLLLIAIIVFVFLLFLSTSGRYDESAVFAMIFYSFLLSFLLFLSGRFILEYYKRAVIMQNATEVEVVGSDYKIIHSAKDLMGICMWDNYYKCKLLLPSIYDKIERGFNNSFIVCQNGKYKIYNADFRQFVTTDYDVIVRYSDGLYLYTIGDNIGLVNVKGDRVKS